MLAEAYQNSPQATTLHFVFFATLSFGACGQFSNQPLATSASEPANTCVLCIDGSLVKMLTPASPPTGDCVRIAGEPHLSCENLLSPEIIKREREARMTEVDQLKAMSSDAVSLRSTERARKTLMRTREQEILHLWDAELKLQWAAHDHARQQRREVLQNAMKDLAKSMGLKSGSMDALLSPLKL
mmetsp:Transcript_72760/g.115142  ORF Transcript_72760/g.115142 Transcript_72760/m.115142 type:complete len:185 (-) Transcript_72760:25-579(-)